VDVFSDRGSTPLASTNKNATTFVVAFLLGFGVTEHTFAPFYHLTAEQSPAYDNSPLRSELTRHSARRPEGRLCKQCVEPEGSWQSAGGTLQPEAACSAEQVNSPRLHQNKETDFIRNLSLYFGLRAARVI